MHRLLCQYGAPAAGVIGLYTLNRFYLIPRTTGGLHRLLAWHFADFLAGGLMLCVLNAALECSGRPPLRRTFSAALFALACGLFWEAVTPLYLPRSVGDPRDVVACVLGSLSMLALLRKIRT